MRLRPLSLAALAAALLCGTAHAQSVAEVFGERSLAIAIDDRCHVFSDNERDALTASWLQARGTLLRAGHSSEDIRSTFDVISRRASTRACSSPEAQGVIAGVRSAYTAFSRMYALDYPGGARVWMAQRRRGELPVWTLSQTLADEPQPPRFGLYSDPAGEVLSLSLAPTEPPSGVAIVLRDPERASEPVDPTLGGLLTVSGRPAWARLAPPRHAEARFWASGRRTVEDRLHFAFPESATQAIARLDPREAARIELYDARGRITGQLYVEIGDFAAALAFLAAGIDPPVSAAPGG